MPKEVDHFVRLTPARSPHIIYNSDTVYSTTTFRPVSPSPITPPAPNTPSPQRTRKLETPLHFDGGLFSDIRSTEGKLLSKVTIDRVQSSTQHDISDSPRTVCMQEGKNYVDAIMKTETITNKDVFTVKFTPVPPELESPWLLTPSQFIHLQSQSPVEYLKANYQELPNDGTETIMNKDVDRFAPVPLEVDSPRLLTPSQFIKLHSQSPHKFLSDDGNFIRTETITKTEVDTVKFTPVPPELDSPRLLTPSQCIQIQSQSPVEYIKDNYEDLQSYKIVNLLCKEKLLDTDILASDQYKSEKTVKFNITNGNDLADNVEKDNLLVRAEQLYVVDDPHVRGHSPLANMIVSEQLTKLDNYLQESLDVCLGRKGTPTEPLIDMKEDTKTFLKDQFEAKTSYFQKSTHVVNKSYTNTGENNSYQEEPISKTLDRVQTEPMQCEAANEVECNTKRVSKLNSVPTRKAGIMNAIYNMPIHYHAAIICAILILYNLIYQYIKQNSQGRR